MLKKKKDEDKLKKLKSIAMNQSHSDVVNYKPYFKSISKDSPPAWNTWWSANASAYSNNVSAGQKGYQKQYGVPPKK